MPRARHAQTLPCVSTPSPRGYHGGTTRPTEGDEMYIGGGILTVILIVLLLIWLF